MHVMCVHFYLFFLFSPWFAADNCQGTKQADSTTSITRGAMQAPYKKIPRKDMLIAIKQLRVRNDVGTGAHISHLPPHTPRPDGDMRMNA